jgi:hypothetical protein
VAENDSVEAAYRRKKYGFDTVGDDAQNLTELLIPQRRSADSQDAVQMLRSGNRQIVVNVFWPVHNEVDRNRSILCQVLADQDNRPNSPLQMMGDFLPFVPSRMGYNAALDRAAACICNLYQSLLGGQADQGTLIRQYVQAVSAVRECVADPAERLASETICATIMLQACEVLLPI